MESRTPMHFGNKAALEIYKAPKFKHAFDGVSFLPNPLSPLNKITFLRKCDEYRRILLRLQRPTNITSEDATQVDHKHSNNGQDK